MRPGQFLLSKIIGRLSWRQWAHPVQWALMRWFETRMGQYVYRWFRSCGLDQRRACGRSINRHPAPGPYIGRSWIEKCALAKILTKLRDLQQHQRSGALPVSPTQGLCLNPGHQSKGHHLSLEFLLAVVECQITSHQPWEYPSLCRPLWWVFLCIGGEWSLVQKATSPVVDSGGRPLIKRTTTSLIQLDWPWIAEWNYAGIFAVADVQFQDQDQFWVSHQKSGFVFLIFSKSQKWARTAKNEAL